MKILKLKALNINSLKGETQIDFRTFLNDNALFAITGPTGAGKSTILDIITCALYGRTPRLKNPNELMARHTGECYCEVEFEIKGDIYRSSWTQKRARKNAEGKFQTAKMELSDVNSAKVLKATLRDVPKYVEELSGLDFDRFKQSMVLAQGGFDAFLKADEKERSTLLEKMTGTQIYKQISLEIYEQYSSHKSEIELDKKILDTRELLDSTEVEEKEKILEENKKQKKLLDEEEKELIQIKIWIETLDKLVQEDKNYSELYISSVKEKEDNKKSFDTLALSNKALNVESLYTQYTTIVTDIDKDEKTYKELISDTELLTKLLQSQEISYKQSKNNSVKAKELFEVEIKKIKDVRVLQTQIDEKQKSLELLDNHIVSMKKEHTSYTKNLESVDKEYKHIDDKITIVKEYIDKHKKDDELLELLPLLKKNIEEYTIHSTIVEETNTKIQDLEQEERIQKNLCESTQKQTQELKLLYESINKEYIDIEQKSSKDASDEERLEKEYKKQELLLKSYSEYIEYSSQTIKEELSQNGYIKEQNHLNQSIQIKQSLVSELKLHIQTLRDKKETELLIKKYEDDRKSLEEGDECYLCGSTKHPYIENSTIVNTSKTINQIEEKELLLTKEEKELNTLNTSLTLIEAKIYTSNLELEKIQSSQSSLYELLQKEYIDICDETKTNLEEKLHLISVDLESIKQRRKDKELLLKKRDDSLRNYSTSNITYIDIEKELTKLQSEIKQLKIEKEKSTIVVTRQEKELKAQYKKYNIEFNHNTYKENYEVLNTKKETYVEKLESKKKLEIEENKKAIEKTELYTKLTAIQNSLKTDETTKIQYHEFIKEQKEKSTQILNIANIEIYETEVHRTYKMIQEEENKLSAEVTKSKTKNEELKKQEKLLKEHITSNKNTQEHLKQKLDTELTINGFEDIEAFKKAILPKEKREELSLICQSIDEKYNRYKTLQIDTNKKLKEHKKEEIKIRPFDEVIQELKLLNEKIDEIKKNIGSSEKELEINTQNRKKNEEKIKELEKKQEKFKVWVKLNEMIGSADGNKFAKFAQGITLDQLISLSNHHLSILSSRYELQRSSEQKQLLEIEVIDSFQGDVIRSVSTLSGGESFIVSLSLALGLSELASQKIAIDSLFLDEGFGTLDEDSLETALNALNLLQSRGKMVGVISHVEALKERIPLQIKVIPKGDGTSFIEL